MKTTIIAFMATIVSVITNVASSIKEAIVNALTAFEAGKTERLTAAEKKLAKAEKAAERAAVIANTVKQYEANIRYCKKVNDVEEAVRKDGTAIVNKLYEKQIIPLTKEIVAIEKSLTLHAYQALRVKGIANPTYAPKVTTESVARSLEETVVAARAELRAIENEAPSINEQIALLPAEELVPSRMSLPTGVKPEEAKEIINMVSYKFSMPTGVAKFLNKNVLVYDKYVSAEERCLVTSPIFWNRVLPWYRAQKAAEVAIKASLEKLDTLKRYEALKQALREYRAERKEKMTSLADEISAAKREGSDTSSLEEKLSKIKRDAAETTSLWRDYCELRERAIKASEEAKKANEVYIDLCWPKALKVEVPEEFSQLKETVRFILTVAEVKALSGVKKIEGDAEDMVVSIDAAEMARALRECGTEENLETMRSAWLNERYSDEYSAEKYADDHGISHERGNLYDQVAEIVRPILMGVDMCSFEHVDYKHSVRNNELSQLYPTVDDLVNTTALVVNNPEFTYRNKDYGVSMTTGVRVFNKLIELIPDLNEERAASLLNLSKDQFIKKTDRIAQEQEMLEKGYINKFVNRLFIFSPEASFDYSYKGHKAYNLKAYVTLRWNYELLEAMASKNSEFNEIVDGIYDLLAGEGIDGSFFDDVWNSVIDPEFVPFCKELRFNYNNVPAEWIVEAFNQRAEDPVFKAICLLTKGCSLNFKTPFMGFNEAIRTLRDKIVEEREQELEEARKTAAAYYTELRNFDGDEEVLSELKEAALEEAQALRMAANKRYAELMEALPMLIWGSYLV